jgi:hypothetical protein
MSEMVTARRDAGFGDVKKASRDWASGIFLNSVEPASFDLYGDGSGERVSSSTDDSAPVFTPFTWSESGAQLLSRVTAGDGTYSLRTWRPVANDGRNRFVIESAYDPRGNLRSVLIAPRVNFLVDDGQSVEAASRAAAATDRTAARDSRERTN